MIFTLLICYAILYALKAVQNPVLRFLAAAALCGITLFSDWPLMAAFFTYFLSEAYEGRTSFTKAYASCIFLFFFLEFAGQADGSPVFKALALTAAASLPLLILYRSPGKTCPRLSQMVLLYLLSRASSGHCAAADVLSSVKCAARSL